MIDSNNLPDAYLRPIAWRGSEMMGVSAPTNTIHLAIAAWDWPSYFDPAEKLKGIRIGMAEYRRPDPATIPAMAKASGLYMICTISKHKAERAGYADAMMLDWQGRVAECTGANIFFIKDGKIHTPIADCFLAGITRATAIDLAKRRGIEVIERRIMPEELRWLHRVLHHRHRGRSDAGVGDRAVEVHARQDLRAVDGGLHRRSAAQGQQGCGVIFLPSPLVGEGGSTTRSGGETGEGFSPRAPQSREPLIRRFAPPSPTREEGRRVPLRGAKA